MPPPVGSKIDTTTPFDWRLKGHKFADIPAHVQGLGRAQLSIPHDADVKDIVPDPRLSVLDLAVFKLPPISEDAHSYMVPPGHLFFSAEEPSVDYLDILSTVRVPPKLILIGLVSKATQQWTDGMNSITIPGHVGKLPLWALQIWLRLHQVVLPAQQSWKEALSWLQRETIQDFADQLQSTFYSLSTLAWDGILAPTSLGRISFPKTTLLTYLSRNWTNDDNVDQMIYLLEHETRTASNFHLMDTILIRKLILAYQNEMAGKEVYNPTGTDFLSVFGSKLKENSRLGGIFHVNDNHWVAIAIDVTSQDLLYGDPAGSSADTLILSSLRWFLSKHIPSLPYTQLDEGKLPCALQDFSKDWFNCAFFSYNTLLHYFLPSHPLLQNTENPAFTDLARLDVLRKIISGHSHSWPNNVALPSPVFAARAKTCKTSVSKRPSTPPPPATSQLDKRSLSSPQKPSAKRPKTAAKNSQIPRSVIAPIFHSKTTLGPKAQEYHDKPEGQKQPFTFSKPDKKTKRVNEENNSMVKLEEKEDGFFENDDGSDTEHESVITYRDGRPRLDILDKLTVELPSSKGKLKKYKCAGHGCDKIWMPRTQARVLAHAKSCVKLTSAQRVKASIASADTAPGALVAASSSTSIASSTNNSSTEPSSSTAKSPLPTSDSFFGPASRKQHHRVIDLVVVKLFCVARLAPFLADLDEWKELFKVQTPSYSPSSRTKLMDNHIMSEQEHVRALQIKKLQLEKRVGISFDGGSIRSGNMFYTVHATTGGLEREVILVEGEECTKVSHTGAWIADLVFRVIDIIGLERIISISADNTGNTRVAREIVCDRILTILNLPDPEHHMNNAWKEIADLEFFSATVKSVRGIIKHFKYANHSKALMKDVRLRLGSGPGLESIGKTRFATLVWAALSVKRSLPAIREICTTGQIVIPKYNDLFTQNMDSLQFELKLTQFVAVGEGFAKAIECLEATSTTPADVYLYWLAVVAHMKSALETNRLPDSVCGEIRGIVVARWREFFVDGPTNVHLSAFYLNPSYVNSSIFKNPNPLMFNITLPARGPPTIPPGIKSPKTFLEVGGYLHSLLVTEINHGSDPFLTCWKTRPKAFTQLYQAQFTAYAQGAYPFTTPLSLDQLPLDWWLAYEGTPNAGILAAIAIKLYSATPHSMADERTMSSVTMINTAQRNKQTVQTVMAMAQVGGYYRSKKRVKLRKSAHPSPVIKFFNVKRLLRSIDDDNSARILTNPNYDESDDEVEGTKPSTSATLETVVPSTVLPVSAEDEDIDMASEELLEILADSPISKKANKTAQNASSSHTVEPEEGSSFELSAWV